MPNKTKIQKRKILDALNARNPQINMEIRAVELTEDQRAAQVDPEEAYRFEISVSSEYPVYRWGEIEILDHSAGAVELDWISTGNAPFLWMHSAEQPLGIVESFSIESGRGTAVIRFGKSALAQEKRAEVINGTLVNISVGYRVLAFELVEQQEDGPATYRVTSWKPMEVSLVTIPADPDVGTNRADNATPITTKPLTKPTEERAMDKYLKDLARKFGLNEDATPASIMEEAERRARTAGAEEADQRNVAEIARRSSLDEIGNSMNLSEDARRFASEGKSVDAFRAFALDKIRDGHKAVKTAADLSEGERNDLAGFSSRKLILGMADGRQDGVEAEMIQEGVAEASRAGLATTGTYIPYMALQRDMTAGNAATAGNLVATNRLGFIEALQAKLWMNSLGVNMLSGLSGNLEIPRATTVLDGEMIGETGTLTAQDLSTDLITLSPKRVGAHSIFSMQLLRQGSPSVDSFVESQQQIGIAKKINSQGIIGTGTGDQMLGLLNLAGTYGVIMGANGDLMDWAKLVEFETGIEDADALIASLGYLTNAMVKGALKTTPKVAGQSEMLWAGNRGSETGFLNDYPAVATSLIPKDGTKGTGTNLSTMIAGAFNTMHLGMWGGLDITIQREKYAESGKIGVVTNGFFDTAYEHPECFAIADDIKTV